MVEKSEFSSDIYTEVYITAKGAKTERAYSDAYDNKVKELEVAELRGRNRMYRFVLRDI